MVKLVSDNEQLEVYNMKENCEFEKIENTQLNKYLTHGYEIIEILVTSSLIVIYIKKVV